MPNNYNSALQSNNTDLQAILDTINELPNAGGSADPVLQDKTVTPTTSKQTITADSGYDGLDTVTVNAMPTATQATPTVSIDSAGKITASATQTAGYVTAGTKSATKQLTTQAAKNITPSTSSQTAVAKNVYTTGAVTVAAIPSTYVKPTTTKSATTYTPTTSNQTIAAGTYCSGAQTIKGDANLKAENIAAGISIFGITGTHSGGGSGGGTAINTCNITVINDSLYGDAYISCTRFVNGSLTGMHSKSWVWSGEEYTFTDVVCGSSFAIIGTSHEGSSAVDDEYVMEWDASSVGHDGDFNRPAGYMWAYIVNDTTPSGTGTITVS